MELAFVNYINIISALLAAILVPVTLMNVAIQLSESVDRNRILKKYNEWRKDYNLLIVVYGIIGMYSLHPLMSALIFINLVIWFVGDLYHFLTEEEVKNV